MSILLSVLLFAPSVAAGTVNNYCKGISIDDDPYEDYASCADAKIRDASNVETYYIYNVPDDGTCVTHHTDAWGDYSYKIVKQLDGTYIEYDYNGVRDCSGEAAGIITVDHNTCYEDIWDNLCYITDGEVPVDEFYGTSGGWPNAPDYAADCAVMSETGECQSWLGTVGKPAAESDAARFAPGVGVAMAIMFARLVVSG